MKKASANMWWIIIGAVIALIVMVVLLAIFTDNTQKINKSLLNCEEKGGTCDLTSSECKTREGSVSLIFSCSKDKKDSGKVCCFPTKSKTDN